MGPAGQSLQGDEAIIGQRHNGLEHDEDLILGQQGEM